jgi:hypothetical protein
MAATKKTSKKSSKGAAKKATKKSAAKKSGAKKAAGYKVPQGKCSGWRAVHNFQPPGPPTLTVTGKCVFPTTGYKVKLVKAVPQGINPLILLLRKIVTPPTGIVLPVLTTVAVKFTLKTSTKYTHVTILPEVVTVKVQQVF